MIFVSDQDIIGANLRREAMLLAACFIAVPCWGAILLTIYAHIYASANQL